LKWGFGGEKVVTVVTISAPSSAEVSEWFNISGIVYDSATGYPTPGAIADLYYNGYSLGSATTGVDGDYLATVRINVAGNFQLKAISLGVSSPTKTITIAAPPPGPFTSVMDFVVPSSLPEGSTVTVRVLAKNTGGTAGRLDVYIDGNPRDPDETDDTVGAGSAMSVQPSASVWLDITCFNMPDWDYILTARNYEGTSQISKTISLGVAPPPVAGHIGIVKYLIEGMAGWENLETYPYKAKVGDEIHLAVGWINDGSSAVVGNVYAQFKSPKFYSYPLDAVLNQDRSANPGSGWYVQFAPFTLNESGTWEFYGQLKLEGTIVDFKKFTFAVEEAPVGIPTTTTLSVPDKAGVNEKFYISGILYETESGIPIPSQPINHSYYDAIHEPKSLGSSTTGVDGDYLKEVSIPESNVWTIKSEFPGTPGYAASRSVAEAIVAASPLEAVITIAGSAAVGIALTMYSLR